MSQRVTADPAGVVVGGADVCPRVAHLLDGERLATQRLRHLLRVVARLGTDRRHVESAHRTSGHGATLARVAPRTAPRPETTRGALPAPLTLRPLSLRSGSDGDHVAEGGKARKRLALQLPHPF